MSRCNNQVGKVEEGHINRNAILRSSTTWPNERVSHVVHEVMCETDMLDNDLLTLHIGPTAVHYLYVSFPSFALTYPGLLHVQPRFADPWEEEPSLAGKSHVMSSAFTDSPDTLDAAYVCCLTCRHGGHANHILPWFNGGLDGEPGHDQCAVAGCNCECANI
jgi:hypothetical protein